MRTYRITLTEGKGEYEVSAGSFSEENGFLMFRLSNDVVGAYQSALVESVELLEMSQSDNTAE